MSMAWVVALLAVVIALAAWFSARRTARELAELTAQYWQLKYDHGELKAKVAPAPPAPADPQQTFVPLSSIKRA
jgi:hypothetical protein